MSKVRKGLSDIQKRLFFVYDSETKKSTQMYYFEYDKLRKQHSHKVLETMCKTENYKDKIYVYSYSYKNKSNLFVAVICCLAFTRQQYDIFYKNLIKKYKLVHVYKILGSLL